MNLSKNKIIAGVIGLVAVVGVVNTQAIVKLAKVNGASYSQSAQVVKATTSYQAQQEYKRGDRSSDVIQKVQEALTKQGFYKSDISGLFGPRTEASVKAFQLANKLPATGVLDLKTQDAILRGGPVNGTIFSASALPCDSKSEPWIRVTSPNGGEVYQAGQEINVTWTKCNVPTGVDVGITLLNEVSGQPLPTFVNHVQIEQTPNDGSQIISASTMQGLSPFEYGNRFKVRLNYVVTNSYDWQTYGNNPAWMQYGDESNNLFTITDEEGCAEGTIIGYDSNGAPIYCGDNIHFGTSACGLEVLTPAENIDIDISDIGYITTIAKVTYPNVQPCGWSTFEGYAGSVKLIDLDTGNILANGIDLGNGSGLHFVSSTIPGNPYSGTVYFMSSLQLVSPLPSNISDNVYLRYTEEISGEGQSVPDQLYLRVNII